MIVHFKRLQRRSPAPTKPNGIDAFRHFPLVIGLFVACALAVSGAPARAQVNIDQGKSAAEMFSGDCATCHKSAKGLANGRSSGALAGFLREHYTSSAEQAASLAAYVLGAGSGPAPSANLKPGTGPGEPKAAEAKPNERGRPGRAEPAASAKLQQPEGGRAEAERVNEPAPSAGRKPAAGRREPRPVTASRGPRQEPETPSPAPEVVPATAPVATPETNPAPVATAPATLETPTPAAAPEPLMPVTAAAPTTAAPAASDSSPSSSATTVSEAPAGEGTPAENAPIPRDDIPD